MKKVTKVLAALTLSVLFYGRFSQADPAPTPQAGRPMPFYIYKEFHSRDNHYAPSGWMGDYGDIRLDDHWRPEGNKDAKTVIRITYSAQARQSNGWTGIYWQNPPNNWGIRPGGFNLNGAKKLVFKAKGDKGGETVEEFKV